MSKTPVTVLQELMIKLFEIPSYECVSQTGPQHQSVFEYRCKAHGVSAHGVARSKKEAKQEAAWRVLAALASLGHRVPAPYSTAPPIKQAPPVAPAANDSALPLPSSSHDPEGGGAGSGGRLDARSYVTLLKELCEEFRLGAVAYELVSDTGPPHMRMFTVRATLGRHERMATATTKKAARQMAAEEMYTYLRENLASATKDFVENSEADLPTERSQPEKSNEASVTEKSHRKRKSTDDEYEEVRKRSCDAKTEDETIVKASEEALSRALDKVMSRYVEVREDQPWRPDLGQRIADYHLAEEQRQAAAKAVATDSEDSCAVLQDTAAALGLTVELSTLPADDGPLSVVVLGPAAPTLTLAGRDPPAAARAALRYLRRALHQQPDHAPTATLASTGSLW